MTRQPNQFIRSGTLVTIPLTNSVAWLKKQISYAKRQSSQAEYPDSKNEFAEYGDALEGALRLKLNNLCPTCKGTGYVV